MHHLRCSGIFLGRVDFRIIISVILKREILNIFNIDTPRPHAGLTRLT